MSQQTAPFLESKYGWNFGESGWNTGMDENLLKFSYMFDRNIDGIVNSLPSAVTGQAYYLTTDKRIYFSVNNSWVSTPVPKWFSVNLRSTGQTYIYNGTVLSLVPNNTDLSSRLTAVELEIDGLGTASLKNEDFFASKDQLDVAVSQVNSYTDNQLNLYKTDISNSSNTAKGASLSGWRGSNVGATLDVQGVVARVLTTNTAEQNAAAIQAAWAISSKIILPAPGTYLCQPVFPPANWVIEGKGKDYILKLPNNPNRMLPSGILSKQVGLIHIDSGSATAFVEAGLVRNLQLVGASVESGFQEQTHLLSLGGAKNVSVENTWFTASQGDAIYLGYGSGDSTERHNFDVYINRCTFDGVNNENRQALSVVDGVNVWMTNCHVKNYTKSTMPGAVDIEPVNGANTTQNIYILNNIFEAVGGTSGVTGYIANHQGVVNRFDRPSNNINIIGNFYSDCTNRGGSFACQVATLTASSASPPLDFTFRGNRTVRGSRVGTIVGSGSVRHIGNIYTDIDNGLFLGLRTDGGNYDIRTEDNTYIRVGKANLVTAGYAMQISTNIELKIKNEDFVDCGRADGTLGYGLYFVDGTSSGVTISGIKVRNITGKTTYAIKALGSHTFTSESNSYTSNNLKVSGNDFKYKSPSYGDFTFATTPANLPIGFFSIAVTDADFPGGRGILNSYKIMDPADGSYAATTYQDLIPTSSSTSTTKTFSRRKVDPGTGLWQTPVVFTGV